MKQIITMIALTVAMLMPMACTQNDGHIGHWFGHWKVTEIAVDGVPDADYRGNVFFAFQSTVFGQIRAYDYGDSERRFANWDDRGDHFIITFPYQTDAQGNMQFLYEPLPETHMSMGENIVNVDRYDGDHAQLSTVTPQGQTVTYSLKKW